MKIIEILPELDIGGVERHVIDLTKELALRGHDVLVISAGGKMQCQLSEKVAHLDMPLHKKNPLTGWLCARKISKLAAAEGYQLIHAHSRVPAWIARWVSRMTGIPYIVTAHVDFGNKSRWIYSPYRDAARVICVSEAVREGMKDCFYDNTQVVLNGLDEPSVSWKKDNLKGTAKFLFVGRLSPVKGLHDVLRAIPEEGDWTLDVLGDGPMRAELESIAKERGLEDKVAFHGYSDKADQFMADSSCLLFPSYTEGMPLTLARAVQIGIPVIASDIPSVCEMAGGRDNLIPPGNVPEWKKVLTDFINAREVRLLIPLSSVPTLGKMADADEEIYSEVIELYSYGKMV
ncbi:glycosyltransferase family 4 protein [Cloacibacillus evryensis]|uniref:glycosyltransferase family 4 protein n=1 Tax=Cloacibacillus evryensis TaxID=508460 RepID=UPI002672E5FB|nr:glycosyltransferase family 4 protein [Cloacibacillus evryensis]